MKNVLAMGSGRRFALLGALTTLAIGIVGVGSAFAAQEINLTGPGPYPTTGSTTVNVKGTVPLGTAKVGVAVCSAEEASGTHCDLNSASEGGALAEATKYTSTGLNISVRRGETATLGWKSYDFTSGVPVPVEPRTLCIDAAEEETGTGTGVPCVVAVSYYTSTFEETSELKEISFK